MSTGTSANRGMVRTAAGQAKRKAAAVKAAAAPRRPRTLSPAQLSVTEELVMPEEAALYLEVNRRQRSIRDAQVDKYADDMRNGRWQLNGSTIVFDRDGNLIDGQHRLWACFQAETPFRTLVARNADPEAFMTIDTGMPRPATDVFTIAGEANVGALSAATRLLWRYNTNRIGEPNSRRDKVSPQELLAYLDKHPRMRDSVERVGHIPNLKRLMTATGAAFAHYLLVGAAGDAAEAFLLRLGRGDQLEPDSPIFRAREAMVNSFGKRANGRSEWAVAIAIKAWNAYRKGKRVKVVAWSATKNEEFPRPIV